MQFHGYLLPLIAFIGLFGPRAIVMWRRADRIVISEYWQLLILCADMRD